MSARRHCFHHGYLAGVALFTVGICLDVPPGRAQNLPNTPAEYLRVFDLNADGKISPDEYVAYLSRGFGRIDSNGDGVLERSELPGNHGQPITLQALQKNLRQQFHRMDRNHDGHLNVRELTAAPD